MFLKWKLKVKTKEIPSSLDSKIGILSAHIEQIKLQDWEAVEITMMINITKCIYSLLNLKANPVSERLCSTEDCVKQDEDHLRWLQVTEDELSLWPVIMFRSVLL